MHISRNNLFFGGHQSMDNQTKQTNLKEKINSFLDRACQEEAGNLVKAEKLFNFALRCEELSCSDRCNTANNVQQIISENGNNNL